MTVLVGCDLETTGLNAEKGAQIIEIGLSIYKAHKVSGVIKLEKVSKTYCKRIEPTCSIEAKAQLVHGISMADLKGCPKWEEIAPSIHKILSKADVFVAHNVEFDAMFLLHEFHRVGLKMPNCEVFCTMENGRTATSLGANPTLGNLCWAFGVKYDGSVAHAADYDIDKTMECFKYGVESGVWKLPELARKSTAA